MAERNYFFIDNDDCVRQRYCEFTWYGGFALSQKQKCIASFHDSIRLQGKKNPLEVSTKSTVELGRKLSAFNLKLNGIYLENVFQSSKVFSEGGPYRDLLYVSPKEAKRDERLRNSGRLTGFRYDDINWPLAPRTVFYDWLYYNAVRECISDEELKQLSAYDAFTDIEFNPEKSLNTQAEAAALVLLIYLREGKLPVYTQRMFIAEHIYSIKRQ